ncbi:MAG: hypothetical protein CR986_09330 [Ignavibacteriae bacterium]|nr:MAG: hypothetical protein CR986_09330 [Ignavibacteriota bacterium]
MNTLPLSWSITNLDSESSSVISRWDIDWIALKNLSDYNLNFSSITGNNNIVIRGCNSEIKEHLDKKGFSAFKIGREAILSTDQNHFKKKSLRELVKRGNKNGTVVSLPYNSTNKIKLQKFRKKSVHGKEPQLLNLFQTEFSEQNFLYVLKDKCDNWLGAVLLSENSKEKLQTELILRFDSTPNGTMEAIFYKIFNDAKLKGYKQFSLGEVPFTIHKHSKSLYGQLLKVTLPFLKIGFNFNSLYNFKNKFEPMWDDLYICTSKKINAKHILFLILQTNFHKLFFNKLKNGF